MYDYLAGGTAYFEVDRRVVEQAATAVGGIGNVRADVRANLAFLARAVRWLAREGGVRQFLDIGTGIPHAGNVAGIAHSAVRGARVVCVDNDPTVLAHAHQLQGPGTREMTAFVAGDLRDPDDIVARGSKDAGSNQTGRGPVPRRAAPPLP
jgi:hypothetical protein